MVTVLRARGDRSISAYIDPERGTISREIYVNPDIFEQEMEQIFQRCWLFLGHGRGEYNDRLPGVVFNGSYTEEAQRARFSRWLAFMEAGSWDDLYPVNKTANHRIW